MADRSMIRFWKALLGTALFIPWSASATPTVLPEFQLDQPVWEAEAKQIYPALAFDGTNYLVAWEDVRPASSTSSCMIMVARVSQAGELLDRPGIPVSTACQVPSTNSDYGMGLAFDG